MTPSTANGKRERCMCDNPNGTCPYRKLDAQRRIHAVDATARTQTKRGIQNCITEVHMVEPMPGGVVHITEKECIRYATRIARYIYERAIHMVQRWLETSGRSTQRKFMWVLTDSGNVVARARGAGICRASNTVLQKQGLKHMLSDMRITFRTCVGRWSCFAMS